MFLFSLVSVNINMNLSLPSFYALKMSHPAFVPGITERCTNFMCLVSFGTNTFKAYPAVKALLQLASPASTGHSGLRNWTPHGWLKMRLELTYIFVTPDQGVTERRRHCASSIIQKRSLGASCRQPRPSHIARDSLESSVNSKYRRRILPREGHKDSTQRRV